MPDLNRILAATTPLTLASLPRGAQPLVMGDLARAAKQRAVFIAPDDAAMRSVAEAARFFAPEVEVLEFPAWDCLPYDRASPALSISAARLSALFRLQYPSGGSQLLVTTVNAALQRVLTPFRIRESVRGFKQGTTIGHESLSKLLTRQGYSRTDTVVDHGEFAVRGSIVDIFPSSLEEGLRLDFFGDELESLRLFDPSTQRSTGVIKEHLLLPASEALVDEDSIKRFRSRYRERFGAMATQDPLYEAVSDGRRLAGMEHWLPLFEEKLATLFDHLAADDVMVIDQASLGAAEERFKDIADYHRQRGKVASDKTGSYRPLETDALYLSEEEFAAALSAAPAHRASLFAAPEGEAVLDFGFRSARDFTPERGRGDNVYEAAAKHFTEVAKSGRKPLFAAYSTGSRSRIASILAEAGAPCVLADSWQQAQGLAAKGQTAAMVLPLDTGFASDELELLTEQDVLGDRLVRRKKKRKDSDAFLAELQALAKGDLVVHVEHGIGKYLGLEPIPVGKSQHDCVALEYHGGDKLFIPVENIDVLSRYGSSEDAVTLDRLGGEAWQKRRARLKERITAIAGELMKVAAERALKKAPVFEADEASFNQFVDRFPWEETDDQDAAIADVLRDLESGKPMDRLVCGDVGFGKTEVALRAAFVAAMSGQQVAVVAPTTLLARQHFENFSERFAGFPLKLGRLSRLVSSKEAAETREGLANGTIDLVVGTHAILSKSTEFKNLGLVIVDEEQHFGVTQKERLKDLRKEVHVLTMTATPIPRTLQMALSGVREMSLIATPPVDRLAVRTFVMPYDGVIIREALLRERYRGGQTFYVCPRIEDLSRVHERLIKLVPDLRIGLAHGRMAPTELEDVMTAFTDGNYDVLLSTNIVESGLDIPSANTIVIHRSDMFGLAQLYQLRGRVGRSKTRAYAYLTTHPTKVLPPIAKRRLEVMQTLDTLGAGFSLASHDMDIRGAGNLLGDEQSGQVKEVGIELYQELLREAVEAARAGEGTVAEDTSWTPQIALGMPVLIPDAYVPDLSVRMSLYRRIAMLVDKDEIDGFAAELADRFGPTPPEVENLLKVVAIKGLCRSAGIEKVDAGPKGAIVAFRNNTFANPQKLVNFMQQQAGSVQLRPDHKLVYRRAWNKPEQRVLGLTRLMEELAAMAA